MISFRDHLPGALDSAARLSGMAASSLAETSSTRVSSSATRAKLGYPMQRPLRFDVSSAGNMVHLDARRRKGQPISVLDATRCNLTLASWGGEQGTRRRLGQRPPGAACAAGEPRAPLLHP